MNGNGDLAKLPFCITGYKKDIKTFPQKKSTSLGKSLPQPNSFVGISGTFGIGKALMHAWAEVEIIQENRP